MEIPIKSAIDFRVVKAAIAYTDEDDSIETAYDARQFQLAFAAGIRFLLNHQRDNRTDAE